MIDRSQQFAQILVERIEAVRSQREGVVFVALDGRSGSGKSTIAGLVAEMMGTDQAGRPLVTVIEGDDFYSGGSIQRWLARTLADRARTVIDWRSLRAVLLALRGSGQAVWGAFDWESENWDGDDIPLSAELVHCQVTPVVLLEGAYSARPELADLIDLRVLLTVPPAVRRAQLLAREGDGYRADWEQVWSEAEDYYYGSVVGREWFDLVLG